MLGVVEDGQVDNGTAETEVNFRLTRGSEPVNSPVPTGLAGANSSTNNTPPLVRNLASEDDPPLQEVVVANLNFCNYVVGGPISVPLKSAALLVDFAGDVTVGVSSLTELAGDVTVGVLFPANLAGGVTVGVAPSAIRPTLLRWRPRPTLLEM